MILGDIYSMIYLAIEIRVEERLNIKDIFVDKSDIYMFMQVHFTYSWCGCSLIKWCRRLFKNIFAYYLIKEKFILLFVVVEELLVLELVSVIIEETKIDQIQRVTLKHGL